MRSPIKPLVAMAVLALAVTVSRAAAETGTVVAVVDGDTLRVSLPGGTRTVRLLGVDTPELGREDRVAEYLAQEAAAFTRDLAHGRSVRLETDPEADTQDVYGRALRYVFLPDGRLLNAMIIAEGFGHADTRFPFARLEEFRELEREARESGRGLWDPDAVPTLAAGEAASHVGSTARVCDRVASTKYSARTDGQPTFLNLGGAYPDQLLTVVIWGTDRGQFEEPEKRYAGKRVCVTGKIRLYKGKPEVVVRDPTQITVDQNP